MTDRNPLAIVTGASSGIGRELAELFARDGYDLIAVADNADMLAEAEQIGGARATVTAVVADLSTEDGIQAVTDALDVDGRTPAAAALNAGIGRSGRFVETDIEDNLAVIDVNVRGTVLLASHVLRKMHANSSGRVLITSSVASTMPGPYQAVYNASKSFLQSFAEGLTHEMNDSGVTVTSLMPGPTDTAFFARARLTDSIMGRIPEDDPAKVAAQGYAAMMQGKEQVVAASLFSKAMAAMNAVTPDSVKAKAHGVLAKSRTR